MYIIIVALLLLIYIGDLRQVGVFSNKKLTATI